MRDTLAAGVPSELLAVASDGLAVALLSTANLDAVTAGRVTNASREAFVDGLHATLMAGAVLMAGAMVLTFALLPRRAPSRQPSFMTLTTARLEHGTGSVIGAACTPVSTGLAAGSLSCFPT